MNKKEENRYSMFRMVKTELENNLAVIATYPDFQSAVTEFKEVFEKISITDNEYQTKTSGKMADFEQAEDLMITLLLEVIKYLRIIAKKENNNELLEIVDVGYDAMKKMRDSNLAGLAVQICQKTTENQTKLAELHYDQAKIDALFNSVEDYRLKLGVKENSYLGRPELKTQLTELFTRADDLLKNKIDDFMELFEDSEQVFYNNYQSARIVKQLGVRHEKPEEVQK